MKRYHEKKNKGQFVQQPVLVSQVCAYRLGTFFFLYNDGYERAEQTAGVAGGKRERGKNTRSIHQGQKGAVCWRDSVQTLTIRLRGGGGGSLLVSFLD